MNTPKARTAAIVGYGKTELIRTYTSPDLLERISEDTYSLITRLYKAGYRRFLIGLEDGLDLIATEAMFSVRAQIDDMRVIVVSDSGCTDKVYKEISDRADEVVIIEGGFRICDYLINNASYIICYYSEQAELSPDIPAIIEHI